MPDPISGAAPAWLRAARRLHQVAGLPVLVALLPGGCFACGASLGSRQRLGACPDCWAELTALRPPLCPSCGLPVPASTDLDGPAGGRCAACVLDAPPFGAARAAVAYRGAARRFLLAAKFGGKPEVLRALGGQLATVVEASGLARGCDVVVPVPSHPWTRLRRGQNAALEIAVPVARSAGLPIRGRLLARRLGHAAAAKRLAAAGRRAALRGAFRASRRVRGLAVLLVDDVMTSGATARACALSLRRAGAREVRVAVWARTLRGEGGFGRAGGGRL